MSRILNRKFHFPYIRVLLVTADVDIVFVFALTFAYFFKRFEFYWCHKSCCLKKHIYQIFVFFIEEILQKSVKLKFLLLKEI